MFDRRLLTVFIVACLCIFSADGIAGTIHVESGDAGQCFGYAQDVTGFGRLDGIQGTLPTDSNLLNPPDIDLFRISIDDPVNFSATTVNSGTSPFLDTQLYLFQSDGTGVIANSITSFTPFPEFRSTIPVDTVTTAGQYLLGIALFGSRPIAADGSFLFPDLSLSDDVATPLTSGVLDDWSTLQLSDPNQDYRIDLTGASFLEPAAVIPEPASAAIWACIGLVAFRGRRRLRRSPV